MMARQIYESEEDLLRERAVIEKIVGDKLEIRKLDIRMHADFALFEKNDGNLRWFIEVRCRNNTIDQYPTLIMSLQKMLRLAELVNTTGKPLALIADWADAIGRFDFRKGDSFDEYDIKWGGRNNLRDSMDVEPVMHIPTGKFKIIGRK